MANLVEYLAELQRPASTCSPPNGGLLEANDTVFDDNALDIITGGGGADLIFGDRSLLGDGVIDLIALQSAQDRLIALN